MIANSIRTYSQSTNDFVVAFNDERPSFIHPEILKIFGSKKIGKTPFPDKEFFTTRYLCIA